MKQKKVNTEQNTHKESLYARSVWQMKTPLLTKNTDTRPNKVNHDPTEPPILASDPASIIELQSQGQTSR